MRTRRIFLALWLALLPLINVLIPIQTYAQNATFPGLVINTLILPPTAVTATTSWIDLSQPAWQDAHYFTLTFNEYGTSATCQIKAEQSSDAATPSDLISNQTCTSSGVTSTASLLASGSNYIRINLGTKTGTGTVVGILVGYRNNPYGSVTVTSAAATASVTDRSGSITVGGTAQTLAASNSSRKRITVENYSTSSAQNISTAESLFISFTGSAVCGGGTGTIEIPAGAVFDTGSGPISTQAVSVCGASTNHRWYGGEQ